MGDTMELAAKFEEVLKTGDFGAVMKLANERAAGRADGRALSSAVSAALT